MLSRKNHPKTFPVGGNLESRLPIRSYARFVEKANETPKVRWKILKAYVVTEELSCDELQGLPNQLFLNPTAKNWRLVTLC